MPARFHCHPQGRRHQRRADRIRRYFNLSGAIGAAEAAFQDKVQALVRSLPQGLTAPTLSTVSTRHGQHSY